MKKILTLLLCTLSLYACADDNQVIQLNQLPKAAQTTLATYAQGQPIAVITMDKDLLETEYEVRFENGNEWKFDAQGNIESLDNHRQALPNGMLPAAIVKYVNQHYKGQTIVEYSVDRRDYEVSLSSGIELTFDKSFKLIKTEVD